MEEMIKRVENKCNKIIEKVKNMINKQLKEFKEKYLLEIKLANKILETYKMKDKIHQLNPNIINIQKIFHNIIISNLMQNVILMKN